VHLALINSYLLGLIVIGGTTVLSVLGLLLARKLTDHRRLKSHHEVGGYMFSILGTLYSVVLGFVVVTVSNDTQQARVNLAAEANAVFDMYRMSDALPMKTRDEIRIDCVHYCQSVVDDEWDRMTKNEMSAVAYNSVLDLWKSLKAFNPVSQQEQAVYSSLLEDYRNLSDARRIRLATALGRVSPVLWTVLVVGAFVTIGFSYFFGMENTRSQLIMTALVALVLSLNLYLVIVESHPFTGSFRVQPAPFKIALELFAIDKVTPGKVAPESIHQVIKSTFK